MSFGQRVQYLVAGTVIHWYPRELVPRTATDTKMRMLKCLSQSLVPVEVKSASAQGHCILFLYFFLLNIILYIYLVSS